MSVVATSSLWTAIAIPSAAVLGAIATMILTRANEATDRRRDRYAEAIRTLVAWTEYPYRVRRRTDDSPATLTALANHGHDLQERLAFHEAWIATEHADLADTYADTRATINRLVGPMISDAWNRDPVTNPVGMNLADWGPGEVCDRAIVNLQHQVRNRFGYRRCAHWVVRRSLGSHNANAGRDQSHPDCINEMQEAQPGADAKAKSLSVDDVAPYWFRIVFLLMIAGGSLTAAVFIGLERFGNLNAAIGSLISLGSLWGLGSGLWSLITSFRRLLRKAQPSLESFVDWAPSLVWKQLKRVVNVMTSSSRRGNSQTPPISPAG